MELAFQNNYIELNDKEIVDKIINKPYNEEAAVLEWRKVFYFSAATLLFY